MIVILYWLQDILYHLLFCSSLFWQIHCRR